MKLVSSFKLKPYYLYKTVGTYLEEGSFKISGPKNIKKSKKRGEKKILSTLLMRRCTSSIIKSAAEFLFGHYMQRLEIAFESSGPILHNRQALNFSQRGHP